MKYLYYLINYIFSFAYDIYYYFFGDIRSRVQGIFYYKYSKAYPDYLKKGNMVSAVETLALYYCKGKGVDIGCGKWPLKGARAVEENKEENAYKINEGDSSQDFVFSSHSLEHLKDWQKALVEWHRVLKTEGVLFLYLPHSVCGMWKVGVNKQHAWEPNREVVVNFLKDSLGMNVIESTSLPDGFLSFIVVALRS